VSVKKIEQALKAPVEVDFVDLPLHDALNYLSEFARIPIEVDKKALDEVGVSTDLTLTLKLRGPALRSGLDLLLEPLTLTYVVGNGVLKVTTLEVAESTFETHQYDVAELIDFTNDQQRDSDYRLLSRAIALADGSKWEDNQGEGGTISLDHEAQSVSIKQSQRAHRAISGLLKTLKKVKESNANLTR